MRSVCVGILIMVGLGAGTAEAQITTSKHGCYRVVGAEALNIRQRPFSTSTVVGIARRGEILVKWRSWCTLRGYWCPVQSGLIKGHADKSYLEPVPCPSNRST